ncbi:RHS repeat-associated core domain-containing protein [Flagellimonas sp. 389]|uniref:RHS repeat-associated core domain-containing protein n=1 Tax=Flagellimonas sp. 389 TaxID=2835862 RepID=UPI0020230ABD|nr:RHS repeat-associated core domain-containing protein [Flagellimonas sp. 389]
MAHQPIEGDIENTGNLCGDIDTGLHPVPFVPANGGAFGSQLAGQIFLAQPLVLPHLTSDANKGITGITYNHLNLPVSVSFNSGGVINYVYDAAGMKLEKTASNGTYTEYAGNYVYENDNLQFFSHPEGYVSPNGSGGYDYVYNYTDHLGNVRLSYQDADNNGSIDPANEIIEENNYYPFGMKHSGYNGNVSPLGSSLAKKFKYQGQELNNSLGYNMYEFELRHYDPTIGRFVTTDPYEQFHSPYVAMGNNPIVSFDPDGGYCYDANGNQIACPTDAGDLYDDYVDSEENHITILDEAVVTEKSKETKANEAYWAEINKRAEILNQLATLETGKTSQGRAEEARVEATPLSIVSYEIPPPSYSSPLDYIGGVGSGLKGLSLLITRLNQVKSIGLPGLKSLTINMKHILSGHVAGGARASSIKTLFASNLSPKQIENMIKTAYGNGKRVKTQGDRIKVVGQAKDGTVIEIWVNKTTKTIETAYPLK